MILMSMRGLLSFAICTFFFRWMQFDSDDFLFFFSRLNYTPILVVMVYSLRSIYRFHLDFSFSARFQRLLLDSPSC